MPQHLYDSASPSPLSREFSNGGEAFHAGNPRSREDRYWDKIVLRFFPSAGFAETQIWLWLPECMRLGEFGLLTSR